MLNKEECNEALDWLYALSVPCKEEVHEHRSSFLGEKYNLIKQLIEEHFSNPPLYMDEIPKGIWIWDNVNKECIRSLGCVELNGIIYVKFERSENSFITNYLEYEPNRFYRKEVRNVK